MKFEQRGGRVILTPAEGDPFECYLTWFQTQEPNYVLADRREYIPGQRHSVWLGEDQGGGLFPWGAGDLYLSRIEKYRTQWIADHPSDAEPTSAEPLPDWDRLLEWFRSPANPLYEQVREKVALVAERSVAEQVRITDQWQNLKDLLSTPNLRDEIGLAWSVGRLAEGLANGQNPLSVAEKAEWNRKIDTFNFPDSCKLA
ncbi:hypothetical protein [Vacuolonema iberomarrocanum]|uniref:hypothetical protein n=1 Tax=Vacuolonema iberomarrocanum TaxID=3454632 RepID=UPI001A0AB2FD|nr:hypothetical protein [filamentous cyanobacterium LEGE 07170]